jgi:hypothetical protein
MIWRNLYPLDLKVFVMASLPTEQRTTSAVQPFGRCVACMPLDYTAANIESFE